MLITLDHLLVTNPGSCYFDLLTSRSSVTDKAKIAMTFKSLPTASSSWKANTLVILLTLSFGSDMAIHATDEVDAKRISTHQVSALPSQHSGDDEKSAFRNRLRHQLEERLHPASASPTGSAKNGVRHLSSTVKTTSSETLKLDMSTLIGSSSRKLTQITPSFYIIKEDVPSRFMYAEVGSSEQELKTNATIVPCAIHHPNLDHPYIICSDHLYNLRLDATQIVTPHDEPNKFKYLDYSGKEVLIQQVASTLSVNDVSTTTSSSNDNASIKTTTTSSKSATTFEMSGVAVTFMLAGGFVGALLLIIACGWLMLYCREKGQTRGKGLLADEENDIKSDGVHIASSRNTVKKQKNRFGRNPSGTNVFMATFGASSGSVGTDESANTATSREDRHRNFMGGISKEDRIQQSFNVHDVTSGGSENEEESERSHISIYFEDEENQDQPELLYDDSEMRYNPNQGVKQSSWFASLWKRPQTEQPKPSPKSSKGGRQTRLDHNKSNSSIASITSTASSTK
jgi:hypothetical protein